MVSLFEADDDPHDLVRARKTKENKQLYTSSRHTDSVWSGMNVEWGKLLSTATLS